LGENGVETITTKPKKTPKGMSTKKHQEGGMVPGTQKIFPERWTEGGGGKKRGTQTSAHRGKLAEKFEGPKWMSAQTSTKSKGDYQELKLL